MVEETSVAYASLHGIQAQVSLFIHWYFCRMADTFRAIIRISICGRIEVFCLDMQCGAFHNAVCYNHQTQTDKMAASKLGFEAERNLKAELADAIVAAKAEAAKDSVYTKESLDALNAAIADAEAIANKENATDKEITDAIDNLQKAIDELEYKDPKAALTAKITAAKEEAAKDSVYTKESLDTLKAAIKDAEAIANKENFFYLFLRSWFWIWCLVRLLLQFVDCAL